MIFYRKILKSKTVKNYALTFNAFSSSMQTKLDEGLLGYKYAKLCYNFCIKSGALRNGIGFEKLTLPVSTENYSVEREIIMEPDQQVKGLYLYKKYDSETNMPTFRFQYFTNDSIRWISLISPFQYTGVLPSLIYSSSVPTSQNYRLNGEDVMIYTSPSEGMWKYNEGYMAEKIESAPKFISTCLHYERMFAIIANGERNTLFFSANLDPTNWDMSLDAGGFIDMQDERGPLNKVVSFNDYVYVFRDFGVARLSAYGDQTTFSVSQLFVSGSKIYGNSVCVCGDKIMLATRDGLHYFDGFATNKLELGIEKLFANVTNDNCVSLYANGKYYLACKLDFDDEKQIGCENCAGGYINNALIEYDLSTNEISVTRGVDINCMLHIDDGNFSKIVASFNGEYSGVIGQMTNDGKFFDSVLEKRWVSPKSNLGFLTNVKKVKEIFVKTKNNCTVEISNENKTTSYNVKGSNKTQRVKTNVTGEQIEIAFVCTQDGECDITSPQIVVSVTS